MYNFHQKNSRPIESSNHQYHIFYISIIDQKALIRSFHRQLLLIHHDSKKNYSPLLYLHYPRKFSQQFDYNQVIIQGFHSRLDTLNYSPIHRSIFDKYIYPSLINQSRISEIRNPRMIISLIIFQLSLKHRFFSFINQRIITIINNIYMYNVGMQISSQFYLIFRLSLVQAIFPIFEIILMILLICSIICYNILMNRRILLSLIVNIILSVSIFELLRLILRTQQQSDETTRIRLMFFTGVHLAIFIGMIIVIPIKKTHSIVLLVFTVLLLASIGFYVCEFKIRRIEASSGYVYTHYSNKSEKLELTYLNLYFLVEMYALIGLVPTGFFLISTEGLICWQERILNQYKDQFLNNISFNEALSQMECSICLVQFKSQDKDNLIEIKCCKHVFHLNCLYQWIKYNDKCPLDRRKIFQPQAQQNNLIED